MIFEIELLLCQRILSHFRNNRQLLKVPTHIEKVHIIIYFATYLIRIYSMCNYFENFIMYRKYQYKIYSVKF